MIAQGASCIFTPEQSTPLQLGHHVRGHIGQAAGQMWHQHVETVRGLAFEPGLQLVGNLCRRADQAVVPASACDAPTELGNAQLLLSGQLGEQLLAAALAGFGERQLRQRAIGG